MPSEKKLVRRQHPNAPGLFTGSYETPAINGSADNVICSIIGSALWDAGKAPAGDSIDRGLALIQELSKRGLELRIVEPNGEAE